MFRAAFPSAEDDCEKQESSWVKANFDLTGANGGAGKDALRLAGTWVNPKVAATIAPDYRLEEVIQPLVNAAPDPMQDYRRSTKPASPHVNGSSSPVKGAAARNETDTRTSPSPGTPFAKRRKEQSSSPAKAELTVAPRRSGRTPSPAPATVVKETVIQTTTTTTTRASRSKATKVTRTPTKASTVGRASGRLTPVEPDQEESEDVFDVPGPDMHEDIKEQQEMIARLKAEREAGKASENQSESQAPKRVREDEDKPLQFDFREPQEHLAVEEREIKSNKRLKLQPQQKSAAWGFFLFAAGLAAAYVNPFDLIFRYSLK